MDGKDVIIGQLLEDNGLLRQHNAQLQMAIAHLQEQNTHLQEKVAQLEKDSHNSSRPPSSDMGKVVSKPRRRGSKRRRGGQPGHQKCSRAPFPPEQVDKVINHELSEEDAAGLEPLDEWHVVQQVELPRKMFTVVEHRARKYCDPATGRITIAPLPGAVRKGGLAGPRLTALMAFLKSACHCSFSTIQRYCREVLDLKLSRGMLCKIIRKTAQALRQPYEQLRERLPHEPYLGADETGHHNYARLLWTWCLQTPQYSFFHINRSRGSKVLFKLLGRCFGGILHADYFSAYRKFDRLSWVRMQYCLAHLMRELRFLAGHPLGQLARWGKILLKWMKKIFKVLCRQGEIVPQQRFKRLKHCQEQFLHWVRQPPDHRLAVKLARRFRAERAADYFRFVSCPEVEPTNNATERALRSVVIDRKVTQGTSSQAGMRWCERAWTAIATCQKQNRNVLDYLHRTIKAYWSNQPAPSLC